MAKTTNKIPTVMQLLPIAQFFDFLKFDVLSPEGNKKFQRLFAKYKISIDTETLKFDLRLLLFEVLREPKERANNLSIEMNFPENYHEAFLQRLKVMLEDPAFVSFAEFSPSFYEEKKIGWQSAWLIWPVINAVALERQKYLSAYWCPLS